MLYLLFIPLCLSACLSQSLLSTPDRLFSPLAQGQVSDYEQGLAHLTIRGASGDAMRLAVHWLHTALCVPYAQKPQYDSPLWEALALGLRAENVRERSPSLEYLRSKRTLEPRSINQDQWATWPLAQGDREGWPDEWPAWIQLKDQCSSNSTLSALSKGASPKGSVSEQLHVALWPLSLLAVKDKLGLYPLYEWYQHLLIDRALYALTQWQSIEVERSLSSNIRVWRWWLKREQAARLGRMSAIPLGWPLRVDSVTWSQSILFGESCSYWLDLYQESDLIWETLPLEEREQFNTASAQVSLMSGLCQVSSGRSEDALKMWERTVSLTRDGQDPITLSLARYHQLRMLIELGRYQDAVALRAVLPPVNSLLFPPFVFSLGEAMVYAGQEDALMALSTEIFRDRSWRADPFLRGLFYLFVRSLSRFSFEGRVIELLEDLGPRRTLYERVFLFAHVALDEGEEDNGRSATTWLLGHHDSARWRPRYHALSARAAILRRDRAAFVESLRLVSPSSGAILSAIHEGRRGAFFEQQDRALVELLRVEIPKIAGWESDTRIAERRRVAWLDLIAEEMQRFLRLRPETRSRKELISLYRSVRQNLPSSALRAYSEKIGRDEDLSVLIGHVKVSGVDLSHLEPRSISPDLSLAPSLTLLPHDHLDPRQWRLTWRVRP